MGVASAVEAVAESGSEVEAAEAREQQWQVSELCFVPEHNISSR